MSGIGGFGTRTVDPVTNFSGGDGGGGGSQPQFVSYLPRVTPSHITPTKKERERKTLSYWNEIFATFYHNVYGIQ